MAKGESRPRAVTQPKLSFPLTLHKIPDKLLQKVEDFDNGEGEDSGSDKNDDWYVLNVYNLLSNY